MAIVCFQIDARVKGKLTYWILRALARFVTLEVRAGRGQVIGSYPLNILEEGE